MDPRHLDNLAAIEATYWWSTAKRALVSALLRRHLPPPGLLIEGGVGAGTNLLCFRELGYAVQGLDRSPEAVGYCRERGVPARVHDLERPWPFEAGPARAVALLDVIEHLTEPVRALEHAAALLEPGGGVVITAPAIPWLMGPWDELLGHRRRYTPDLLREQAAAAGLQVIWMSHWNAFSLPPALLVRAAERLRGRRDGAEFPPVPERVNAGLQRAAALERRLLERRALPLGLSIAAVLRR